MLKKSIKIILINLSCLIVLFLGFEYYFFKKEADFCIKKIKIPAERIEYALFKDSFENNYDKVIKNQQRKPVGLKYSKRPILFLGCSYAYGQYLKDEETISYNISEKAKRPVYNLAYPSWGIQHAYFIIQNMPKIEPDPEYIFYIMINNQKIRMYEKISKIGDNTENLQYKMKNGKFKKVDNRYNVFDNSFFFSKIKHNLLMRCQNSEWVNRKFKLYIKNLDNIIKEVYPESKFVILVYGNEISKNFFQNLKTENIKIVFLEELCNTDFSKDEYKLTKEEDYFRHPNGLAWDIVSDKLIKKFDL